ncbi:BFD-like [2Fe-2S] binding domain protein [Geobacter sp. OR-1]|nr:BFD-like [2Fe-2S] binding domain protein [Geobacter sp. OR-1]
METLYTENILYAPMAETVCWCSNISKKSIIEAIQNGAVSIDDIRKMTGACTLGRCKEMSPRKRCCSKEIMQLLNSYISS